MAGQIRTQQDLSAMMRMMMNSVMERVLDVELDVHLGRRELAIQADTASPVTETQAPEGAASNRELPEGLPSPPRNRRNGHSKKTVQGDMDQLTLATPRDRNGTFGPLLVHKHQRRISDFDETIIALFAKGLSTRGGSDSATASSRSKRPFTDIKFVRRSTVACGESSLVSPRRRRKPSIAAASSDKADHASGQRE